jgi:hypothetical protein
MMDEMRRIAKPSLSDVGIVATFDLSISVGGDGHHDM